jgi:hypothetical protein
MLRNLGALVSERKKRERKSIHMNISELKYIGFIVGDI